MTRVNLKMAYVFDAIVSEMETGANQHPNYPVDPLRRVALVAEEAGEALREALDLTRFGIEITEHRRIAARLQLELTQTAAMCVRCLMEMRGGG